MRIASATIDCWLYTTGHGAGGVLDNAYSDYQHHHWDIMASSTIDHTLSNKPAYTWTCDGNGKDDNGSWSTSNMFKTSNAQAWINSANMVILKQTVGFGVNQVNAIGSSAYTNHQIPELTWPTLTWSPSINTPSSITFSDGRPPSTKTIFLFVNGKRVQEVVHVPGFGGEDYTNKTQFFQKPAVVRVTAWWSWTINLS